MFWVNLFMSTDCSVHESSTHFVQVRHPGRTLVFVNAVSATRRLAALLAHLGLPAIALHASQQQRQRLKVSGLPREDWRQLFLPTRSTRSHQTLVGSSGSRVCAGPGPLQAGGEWRAGGH